MSPLLLKSQQINYEGATVINLIEKPMRIIRLPELLDRTGLSKSTVYDKLNIRSPRHDPDFPRPRKLGVTTSSAVGWSEDAVDSWIKKMMAA